MEPVTLLALGGLLLLFGKRRKKGLDYEKKGAELRMVSLASGVTITKEQEAWLEKVARAADVGIYVTSGQRTAPAQARAMLDKLTSGGEGALYDLYKDDSAIKALLSEPRTVAAWAEKISELAKAGRKLSNHLDGNAVDVSTRLLSEGKKETLLLALTTAGGAVLDEGTHYHVDIPA